MSSLEAVAAKIATFQMLPKGWDYGRDGPASEVSRVGAMALLWQLNMAGVTQFDAAPGNAGAITIIALKDGEDAEITCRPNGTFDVHLHPVENTDEDTYNLSLGKALEVLRGSGWLQVTSSILCTLNGIYLALGGTQARHLRTQVTGRESPSYVWIASRNLDGQFVTTFDNSPQPQFRAIPPSSGEYQKVPFQQEAC